MSELRKTLGTGTLIAVGAAGVIGSSFLYLSSKFFSEFGVGGVIVGMIGATFLASCVAVAISELTSAFPRAGGEYVYATVAFNRPVGFFVGWTAIGIYVGIVAFYVTATGFLLSSMFPKLNTLPLYTIGGEPVYLPVLLIGIALMAVMLGLNWLGAQLAFSAQLILFIVMVILGSLLVFVGFVFGDVKNIYPPFSPEVDSFFAAAAKSMQFVLPALGFLTGFSIVAVMAEEAKVKARRLGFIVILAVVIAGAFYTVIFTATGLIIPWMETAQMESGTIDAFKSAGFTWLAVAAFFIGVIGIVTTFLAVFSAVSRLLFSIARAGMLPAFLARNDNRLGVPRNALLFTAVTGLAMGWLGPGGLVWFLNIGGVNLAITWVVTVCAFYRLRRTHPHLKRPYKANWSWLPALGGFAGIALIVASLFPGSPMALSSPAEYIILIVWPLLGFSLYALQKKTSREETLKSLLGDLYETVEDKNTYASQ